ncbi:MAG: heparan-alpha-glucosaminide N-acetyltransferase domain-containing protein [Pseudomonadota bacterium]
MSRIGSIDALRGVVMVIMLIDHIRETFYLHKQVADPVDVTTTEPELFFIRFLSSLCAPVFVFLTGLGAWLYGRSHTRAETSAFLLKRGLFLILLEVTVINFSWTGQLPPSTIYLQVIWVIGLAMVALAGLLYLPRIALFALAVLLVAGHHVLEPISVEPGSFWHPVWAIIYQRDWIEFGESLRARTSYPLLPWIGVIGLGYVIGPWFSSEVSPSTRMRRLTLAGIGALIAFIILRWLNIYGDAPRIVDPDTATALMSFLSLTKYPPSLFFNLSTLGVGALLLAGFERLGDNKTLARLSVFGAAPMFFYIMHLYVLKIIYVICLVLFGKNQGDYFGLSSVATLMPVFVVLLTLFYFPTSWFSRLKRRRRDIGWLKYF